MTILIIGIAVVGIALGAAGAVWAQDYWRQRKAPRELKPILDWRPTLRMDARATAEAELSEDDNVPANWTLQTEEIRLVESVGGYPHVEIRWRPATRREVRDFVSTYQRIRADEIKERMNKLYASDVNVVGHLDWLSRPTAVGVYYHRPTRIAEQEITLRQPPARNRARLVACVPPH